MELPVEVQNDTTFPRVHQGSTKFNRNTLKISIVFGAKGSARIRRGPTKYNCSHHQAVYETDLGK